MIIDLKLKLELESYSMEEIRARLSKVVETSKEQDLVVEEIKIKASNGDEFRIII